MDTHNVIISWTAARKNTYGFIFEPLMFSIINQNVDHPSKKRNSQQKSWVQAEIHMSQSFSDAFWYNGAKFNYCK